MNRIMVLLLLLGVAGGVLHVKQRVFGARPVAAPMAEVAPAQIVAERHSVAVFGRDGCSITRRMLDELAAARVPVRYHDIDHPAIQNAFHQRFKHAGLMRDGSYPLPIVEVAGQAYARPSPGSVIYRFQSR